jgi:hypothetical protein
MSGFFFNLADYEDVTFESSWLLLISCVQLSQPVEIVPSVSNIKWVLITAPE